ncbi:MAG: magnesium transporter CorA family protein [Polaromonas sp.]|uniref:magnesium transporter CorA family protein n=1 Tax=Polaromonas sp. TaxID=1869339 RepID=UPI00272F41E8|nr:magnesium transporter CorA family protein [Polaromonas sp.]MDP1741749.1 magnesium transporter CorA family protein [Polaromonas sp.]MDP1956077.1 magnesium transporter CorA family protein [Polaromonas sp.]MDP3752342.1 magnesium transporter CorA family protein [Polaromonas sp.]
MQIVEFTADSLRFSDALPAQSPTDGFVWLFFDRDEFETHLPLLQQAAQQIGGSALLDLHCQDLGNAVHPSHYDFTSIYDLIVFRRLATQVETRAEAEHDAAIEAYHGQGGQPRIKARGGLPAFNRISSRAVGFVVFDRLLISVHPRGCYTAKSFIERSLTDAKLSVDAASARSRIPASPADLVLRMVNTMVDSYLDVRKELTTQLEHWQAELLKPNSRFINWGSLMGARSQLHVLEDLCDEQHDAMQEWLDSLREQPMSSFAADAQLAQTRRDQMVARARDVIEHIQRVVHHARRLEQSAETVVQIHFSAQSNRTNSIMRTLTALTAIFLPLNLITGFFGMNFEFLPLIHTRNGFWWIFGFMIVLVAGVGTVFWRKQYLARTAR